MKKILVLILIWSVPIFSNIRDTCIVVATIEADFVQHVNASNNHTSGSIIGPVTAHFTGIVVPSATGTFSVNVTAPVTGTINGTLAGIITGNITNFPTGVFNGTFTGSGTGTLTPAANDTTLFTGDITGIATGIVICSEEKTTEYCGERPLTCNASTEYPYKVCSEDEDGELKPDIICTACPDTLENVIKINLPIRIDFGNSNNFQTSIQANYGGMTVRGNILDPLSIAEDLIIAANKWNCICDYSWDADDYEDESGTALTIKFSDDWAKFEDPYTDRSSYRKDDGQSECDNSIGTIYFNMTSEFWNATPSPTNPDQTPLENPVYKVLITNANIFNINHTPIGFPYSNYQAVCTGLEQQGYSPVEIYNFIDVSIIQFGEVLGMVWDPDCDNCPGNINVMAPKFIGTYPINNEGDGPAPYWGLGGANNKTYGDCSKCQFKALYCPDEPCLIGIYEYQPQGQKLYPNPGERVVTIDFALPKNTENLKITIQDVLGQTRLIPIENGNYEAGEQSILINVDALPVGVYYVIIEAGAYRTAQPLTIVR